MDPLPRERPAPAPPNRNLIGKVLAVGGAQVTVGLNHSPLIDSARATDRALSFHRPRRQGLEQPDIKKERGSDGRDH